MVAVSSTQLTVGTNIVSECYSSPSLPPSLPSSIPFPFSTVLCPLPFSHLAQHFLSLLIAEWGLCPCTAISIQATDCA